MVTSSRVVTGIALALGLFGAAHAEDWKLTKDEAGIRVYLSEVEGSKYKAYRGITTIKADVATLRSLQEDVTGACAWIHTCESQKLLKQQGDESWVYTRFKTPWPVASRDSILHVVTSQTADGGLKRTLEGLPDYLPKEADYVRVASVTGYWTLLPKGGDEVEVTYQVHTDPGGSVPSWLANSFVVDAPFNTLRDLRAKAENRPVGK
ncbi:START domain-containing protein [Pseudomonas sp. LRF_L74]|uniref:START domain-containing protein n=1 Tax=Pseudomonas sp. LRF_L74 TaxID=3369422 RepID=UPI003F5D7DAC